ncbi:MAG TPA: winged helix-turn-helix transcriptional regulator [Thermoleophilaceae bacterium]|nr:winged helix-turn-helix transcriptional regulator [Thermoleophilaceae bacterium]
MRSYQQYCPAARALDVIGERWTILVVRELLAGPKRYTDLQDGLPGIGPNVLAERLRSLEDSGLVEKRRMPPPAASTVYRLTELGEGLQPVLGSLFEWGLQLVGKPGKGDAVKASYWLPAIQAAVRPGALGPEVHDSYEFRVGDESIVVTAEGGFVRVTSGAVDDPDVILTMDHATFADIGRGLLTSREAEERGRLKVEGDAAAVERCARLFGAPVSAGAGT